MDDNELIFTHAFQKNHPDECVPDGFDAVVHTIDGRLNSKLDWALTQAALPTLFDLELGLFHELKSPIQHMAQFQALSFSVNKLVSQIDFPAGCILYKGPFIEDQAHIDFLALLVNSLPAHITPFALQDASSIQDPILFANTLLSQQAAGLRLALQNPPFATESLTWNRGTSRGAFIGRELFYKKALAEPSIGLVVHDTVDEFKSTIEKLIAEETAFKIIPEERLTVEWDGLDSLILPKTLLPSTQRKLQGFQAAGGTIFSAISHRDTEFAAKVRYNPHPMWRM